MFVFIISNDNSKFWLFILLRNVFLSYTFYFAILEAYTWSEKNKLCEPAKGKKQKCLTSDDKSFDGTINNAQSICARDIDCTSFFKKEKNFCFCENDSDIIEDKGKGTVLYTKSNGNFSAGMAVRRII